MNCSGLGSIFQIFPLTVNQSLEPGNISSFKGSVLTFCFFVNFPFTIYLKKKKKIEIVFSFTKVQKQYNK